MKRPEDSFFGDRNNLVTNIHIIIFFNWTNFNEREKYRGKERERRKETKHQTLLVAIIFYH